MDALGYKLLVLEWARQSWTKGLVNNLDEITAVNLSTLHPELLENAIVYSPGYPAIDVTAAIQRQKISYRREQYVAAQMHELQKLENVDMYTKVEKLLDADLAGIDPAKAGIQYSFVRKASIIAAHELHQHIVIKAEPDGYNHIEDKRKHEFRVFLSTLIGGHGGSVKVCAKLFFKYKDKEQFSHFLKCLQDETQLSVIPPIGIAENPSSFEFLTATRTTGPDENRQLASRSSSADNSSASSQTLLGSEAPSQPALPVLPNPHRRRILRGYTLDDGPWLYRLAKPKVSGNPHVYYEIKDLNSYVTMVEKIQMANSLGPETPETVAIISHSMDQAATDKWKARQARQIADDLQLDYCWGMDEESDDGIDYSGDTYSQWLAKRMAQ